MVYSCGVSSIVNGSSSSGSTSTGGTTGSGSSSTVVSVNNKLLSVSKRITKLELNSVTVQELLAGNGGILTLPTANYTELNEICRQYWAYHTPYGVPGDEIWVVEDFQVVKVCSTLDSYACTLKFRDDTEAVIPYNFNMPLTKKDTWIPASSMPPHLSRLKMVIHMIACSGDYSEWQFTLNRKTPEWETE